MTKTEMDIRSVLGPAGGSIRPLAAASDLFARRMFEERMDSEDIFLTKDIYPIVADIMIYFAWYSHKGIPYFEAMKGKQPLLF